jgi:hypothetical protein
MGVSAVKGLLKLAAVCFLAASVVAIVPANAADNALSGLTGSWGGNGVIKYTDGSTERMRCNARYTGGGSDMAMAINCSSSARNIDLSGKLHNSNGRISGNWAESTLGLSGSASGKASAGHLNLGLGGGVSGSMSVTYAGSHQDVGISVEGAALQSVSMTLSKR